MIQRYNLKIIQNYSDCLQETGIKSSPMEDMVVGGGSVVGSGQPSLSLPSDGVDPSGQHPKRDVLQASVKQPSLSLPLAGVTPSGQHLNSASSQVSYLGQPKFRLEMYTACNKMIHLKYIVFSYQLRKVLWLELLRQNSIRIRFCRRLVFPG